MRGRRTFGYVYSATVTFQGQVKQIDGTAWSLERCDEHRLRALAQKDAAEAEGVPLAVMDVARFWYSEIVTDGPDRTAGADPFRPRDAEETPVDPFSPGSGHPCTGDL